MKKIIQNKKRVAFFILSIFFLHTQAQITFQKTFGGMAGDIGYSVKQTTDGGYIIAGFTDNFGAAVYDVYLIKTDTNGDSLWTKSFGGTNSDVGYSVQQTTDGGYIITGFTKSFGAGNNDIYLIKTDANGDLLWTKTFGGTYDDGGFSAQQTADGGYIIAGYTESFGAGIRDVYLVKTDFVGDLLWTKTFGGGDYDWGNSIQQTTDGGYIITALSASFFAGASDVYLIKTDANGDSLWTKTFGGTYSDQGNSVQQTGEGGYIIVGSTASFSAGVSDIYLIKTDSLGNSGCNQGNTATIITIPPTFVTSPPTIVNPTTTIVTTPSTIVGSGGIVITLCATVSISKIIPDNSFLISPNPLSSEISIKLQKQNIQQAIFIIKNILGQTVFTEQENNLNSSYTKTIDVSFLSKGVYFFEVNADGERMVRKIVKE